MAATGKHEAGIIVSEPGAVATGSYAQPLLLIRSLPRLVGVLTRFLLNRVSQLVTRITARRSNDDHILAIGRNFSRPFHCVVCLAGAAQSFFLARRINLKHRVV